MIHRRRPQPPLPISPRHRRTIYAVGLMLLLTGGAWLLCRYFLREATDFDPLPNAWEPFWLKLHGAAAMVALLVVGSLLPWHAWRAWQVGRNRMTGAVMVLVLLAMALTGWALYYVGGEEWRPVIALLHWIPGLLGLPALVWHVTAARKRSALMRRHAHAFERR